MNVPSALSTTSPCASHLVRRGLLGLSLVASFAWAGACTAILAPKDDVQRCRTVSDCNDTQDNRYVSACKFDDAHSDLDSSKVEKICVATYEPNIGCDETGYMNTAEPHPFVAALSKCGQAIACDDENRGAVGCPPPDGEPCNAGLELKQFGTTSYCDDPNAEQPVIPSVGLPGAMLAGQDVRDQFCKSYFCDDSFICGPSKKCVPCDPEKAYGEGGCGIVYANGGPTPVYVLGEELAMGCLGPEASVDMPLFGGMCL